MNARRSIQWEGWTSQDTISFITIGKFRYFHTSILPFTLMVRKELFCSIKTNRTDCLECQKTSCFSDKKARQFFFNNKRSTKCTTSYLAMYVPKVCSCIHKRTWNTNAFKNMHNQRCWCKPNQWVDFMRERENPTKGYKETKLSIFFNQYIKNYLMRTLDTYL